ncbi:MAG: Frag1/DRAM/Sfk1 family protein, partial [Gammaproteobacteria bacterium]|nr:Frag1/DRAM/Sfk1 family protein [Gammaproteobacteria bacterium]
MKLKYIALAAGLPPLISVHIAYILAVQAGHVPSCFPYIDGCTSISSTGRQPPESFVFKGTMIPSAVFIGIYWMLVYSWLRKMGDDAIVQMRAIFVLGIIAALGLIFYTVVLGHIGEIYRLQRRIGVTLYFALSYLAQLILVNRLHYLIQKQQARIPNWIYKTKLTFCVLILGIGIA